MTSQPIRLSTNFMTLIPSLTFTDYEWFPWSICNGCGMPAGNAYPSGHLVPSPFWDLLMLQLLRPNSSNLPCLYSTFHLEYPLVLSRFCFVRKLAEKDFYSLWSIFCTMQLSRSKASKVDVSSYYVLKPNMLQKKMRNNTFFRIKLKYFYHAEA